MEILAENRDFVVCVKPVGLDSEREVPRELGGTVYPIHRLDKNVGGVMVYGRSKAGAAELSKAVQAGTLKKTYYAVVHGNPPHSAQWEDLLWKDGTKNKVFVVKRERKGVKQAILNYEVLSYRKDTAFVKIYLQTGRSHQIRVQFSTRGFPLVGDHKYGSRDEREAPMLFSCGLMFPFRGKEYTFSAKPDWPELSESDG